MKNITKLLCLMLALLMLVCAFAACGKDPADPGKKEEDKKDPQGEQTDPGEEDEDGDKYGVPDDLNFNNREITFLMRNNAYYISDMWVEGLDKATNTLDQEVWRRNMTVQQKYGILVKESHTNTGGNLIADTGRNVSNEISTGDAEYDVVVDHGRGLWGIAFNGYAKNILSLPYLNTENSWWSQGMVHDFTVNDQLFVISGDLSYQSLGATVAVLINKTLCNDLGMEVPYQEVIDGTWTFEKFETMTKKADAPVNDTYTLAEGATAGFFTTQYRSPLITTYAAGGMLIEQDDDGELVMAFNTTRVQEAFEKLFKLLDQPNSKVDERGYSTVLKEFAHYKLLFTDTRLYDIKNVINEGFTDYGVLPFPKYYEDLGAYYTWCDAVGNCFLVPGMKTADDYEFIGAAMEALAYYGNSRVIPYFYEDVLKRTYAQDEFSFQVMDLIKAGRKYDIGCYYTGYPFGNLGTDLITYPGHSFASYYASKIDKAEEKLIEINEKFEALKLLDD